ncbi:MAG TPA: DUF6101 family protein [Methylocella sp.]|nr:DUF6101 family protein [Methylocella sp.]
MRNSLFAADTLAAGAPNAMLARAADDARADGGRRMILLAPRCVTIRRRLRGVKMLLHVPTDSYKRIVLSREDHPSGARFILRLSHRDPELSVTLLTSNNRGTSIEAWHRWAAYFAVPELIECGGGHWELIDTVAPGGKTSLPDAARRRAKRLANRRSRLALCRASMRVSGQEKIFRGERLIISYE